MRQYFKLLLVLLGLTGNGQTQSINSTFPQIRQIGEDDPCAAELGVISPSDNLSCEFVSQGFARCYNRSELCNGDQVCLTGSDEGANMPALDCTGLQSGSGFPVFQCTAEEVVTLDQLCDGNADCGAGEDEISPLCENKCRLPYYGGCVFTRECLSSALSVTCPRCLNGFVENISNPSGECLVPSIVMFSFSQATYNVSEADGVAEVCIQLISGTLTANAVIDISTQPSSARSFDFVMTSEFVTFPSASVAGQLKCIQIGIINDDTVEGTETFFVNAVSNDQIVQINAGENRTEVIIFDDDSLPVPIVTVAFVQNRYNVSEGDGAAVVCIELISSMPMVNSLIGVFTQSESAGSSDFIAINETLIFPPESALEDVKCIHISITDDTLEEDVESFSVFAYAIGPHVELMDDHDQIVVYIIDNDGDAPLFLSPPPTDESAEYLAEFRESFNIGCTAIISDPSTFEYLLWRRLDGSTSSLITSESIVTTSGSSESGSGSGNDMHMPFKASVHLQVAEKDGGIQCSDAGQYECAIGFNMPQVETVGIKITIRVNATSRVQCQLESLARVQLTRINIDELLARLSEIVAETLRNTTEQTAVILLLIADIFESVAYFVVEFNIILTQNIMQIVVQIVGSLVQWNTRKIAASSSSRIVESFEVIAFLYTQQIPVNTSQSFNFTTSLILVAERLSLEEYQGNGRNFTFGVNENADLIVGQLTTQQGATISLPASVFTRIINQINVGAFFAFYNRPTLFPLREEGTTTYNNIVKRQSDTVSDTERRIGSPVLASTIVDNFTNFDNLTEPVTVTLKLFSDLEGTIMPESLTCVTWDFGLQNWTSQGCTTTVGKEGIVICVCSHLTNFGVLVDICLRQEDCRPSIVNPALTYISYIGMSVSIVSLTVTVIVLFSFKKLWQNTFSKYHVQLSLSLMLTLITAFLLVVFSAEKVATLYGGCVTVSVLVHYFTLVAVMWMGAEALLMFQKLVIVHVRITTKFIIFISALCWLLPVIPVIIPLIVDLSNGMSPEEDIIIQRQRGDVSFCFLSHIGAFWGAFLAPIIIIILFNVVIFVCVLVVLIHHTSCTATRSKETLSKKAVVLMMIRIGGVMFLFGLTWLFAILTFSVPGLRETFQILFTLFNSFQGFFIFLFLCVFSKDAQESWKGSKLSSLFCCSKAHSSGNIAFNVDTASDKTQTSGKNLVALESNLQVRSLNKTTDTSLIIVNERTSDTNDPVIQPDKNTKKVKETLFTESALYDGGSVSVEKDDRKRKGFNNMTPLKINVRRFSTKKEGKHHVEEMEVKINSDSSSDDDTI